MTDTGYIVLDICRLLLLVAGIALSAMGIVALSRWDENEIREHNEEIEKEDKYEKRKQHIFKSDKWKKIADFIYCHIFIGSRGWEPFLVWKATVAQIEGRNNDNRDICENTVISILCDFTDYGNMEVYYRMKNPYNYDVRAYIRGWAEGFGIYDLTQLLDIMDIYTVINEENKEYKICILYGETKDKEREIYTFKDLEELRAYYTLIIDYVRSLMPYCLEGLTVDGNIRYSVVGRPVSELKIESIRDYDSKITNRLNMIEREKKDEAEIKEIFKDINDNDTSEYSTIL